MNITIKALSSLAALMLAGCVTPYPQGEVANLDVADVRSARPDIPQPVRWGGTIASIDNREDGSTVLEIVSRPLTQRGRPIRDDSSDGRFMAVVNDVLDPTIIKPGRDITVTGLVGELREGTIGESPYSFPVVDVDDYHYWSPASARTYAGGYPYGYPYGHGCYNNWPHPYRSSFDCGFHGFGSIGFSHRPGRHGHRGHRGNVGLSLIFRP